MKPVMPEIVSRRAARLRRLVRAKSRSFARSLVGVWREAVVETEDLRSGRRQATMDNYATVLVPRHLAAGTRVEVCAHEERDGVLIADEFRSTAATTENDDA